MYYWIVLMVLSIGFSQEFGKWRWADDTAEFTMDKEAHFVGSSGAYFFFRHKDYTELQSIRNAFLLGLTKECIDAILPWEQYGKWGGDGFSKYDLAYNTAGIGLAYIIDKLWEPKENNNDFYIRYGNGGVSFSYRLYR